MVDGRDKFVGGVYPSVPRARQMSAGAGITFLVTFVVILVPIPLPVLLLNYATSFRNNAWLNFFQSSVKGGFKQCCHRGFSIFNCMQELKSKRFIHLKKYVFCKIQCLFYGIVNHVQVRSEIPIPVGFLADFFKKKKKFSSGTIKGVSELFFISCVVKYSLLLASID